MDKANREKLEKLESILDKKFGKVDNKRAETSSNLLEVLQRANRDHRKLNDAMRAVEVDRYRKAVHSQSAQKVRKQALCFLQKVLSTAHENNLFDLSLTDRGMTVRLSLTSQKLADAEPEVQSESESYHKGTPSQSSERHSSTHQVDSSSPKVQKQVSRSSLSDFFYLFSFGNWLKLFFVSFTLANCFKFFNKKTNKEIL